MALVASLCCGLSRGCFPLSLLKPVASQTSHCGRKPMMTRIVWFFVGLAVILTAASGYLALKPNSAPQPDWIVTDAEQDLGEVGLGIHEVTVRLANPSNQLRRVIGMTELCVGSYCFMMKHPNDTVVQPGESCLYKFDLLIKKPGPFTAEGTLFLEGNGLKEVPVRIHGNAILPPRRPPAVSKLSDGRPAGLP
jgi:hypothetical protein